MKTTRRGSAALLMLFECKRKSLNANDNLQAEHRGGI
jgi:hypothetical protein